MCQIWSVHSDYGDLRSGKMQLPAPSRIPPRTPPAPAIKISFLVDSTPSRLPARTTVRSRLQSAAMTSAWTSALQKCRHCPTSGNQTARWKPSIWRTCPFPASCRDLLYFVPIRSPPEAIPFVFRWGRFRTALMRPLLRHWLLVFLSADYFFCTISGRPNSTRRLGGFAI